MNSYLPITLFFVRFLERDARTINALTNHQFYFSEHELHFTLPQLHAFLTHTDNILSDLRHENTSYLEFRKHLFNSPINQQLANHDAEVFIVDNAQHVDRSTYGLRKVARPFCLP
ncbi:hypothetical protein A9Q99_04250 [Gammaproteobacteria bacterium 45_16_T64]|nr:hypothetical protein A9Q99_04250 [Gammaproteobacteria bacterium 45_16_T64]